VQLRGLVSQFKISSTGMSALNSSTAERKVKTMTAIAGR